MAKSCLQPTHPPAVDTRWGPLRMQELAMDSAIGGAFCLTISAFSNWPLGGRQRPAQKRLSSHLFLHSPALEVVRFTRSEFSKVAITLRRDVARPSHSPVSLTVIATCALDGIRRVRPGFLGNTAQCRATSRRSVMATENRTTSKQEGEY